MNRIPQETKDLAVKLRLEGTSIRDIAEELKISKGTAHSILKDVVLTDKLKNKIETTGN